MLKKRKSKKILWLVVGLAVFFGLAIFFSKSQRVLEFSHFNVEISENGRVFSISSEPMTIEDFLNQNHLGLAEKDVVFPEKETWLHPNMRLIIRRAIPFSIEVDGKTIQGKSVAPDIFSLLQENNLSLGRLDRVTPNPWNHFSSGEKIVVTRINVEEKIIPEDIPFKKTVREDPKLGWREEKIEQKGEKGIREIKYRITYKNNREISREVLEKNITREPQTEISVKGTFMKLGSASKGQATWYAFKGGMFAASTTIPRGGFAKVTNVATGKSIVVEINDYGPQGKGRIIDLDKVAFAKIASLGAGVIGVKVEQVLN